ncbi:translesion DNA synthesis-associated protein ImuA [Vibrio sp. S4M6]|uniref:translesion DNA synthesis-associated protein ImuA n=1 Tax=Vibrio sinus TaxID=2946865 RepID=UPI00202A21EB|nr:translesion DNA synthesis-associated protein ImuA [Vibrio sinus]MCL9783609.1 translesion DNA synthesis-associated protein ImuA [Vibrio sinus]
MHELINQLKSKQLIWQGSHSQASTECLSTGFRSLDDRIGGGFPTSGVIEIKTTHGIGELRLLWPHIKRHSSGRSIVLIQPPGKLCAESLYSDGINLANVLLVYPKCAKDALWAAEQCLKSGACSHVLLWQDKLDVHHAKRLQVASEQRNCLHFLFKAKNHYTFSLPVSLSMTLLPHLNGLEVAITKRRGGWPQSRFIIPMNTFTMPLRSPTLSTHLRKLG